jgi:hypothetical protein
MDANPLQKFQPVVEDAVLDQQDSIGLLQFLDCFSSSAIAASGASVM